MYWFVCDFRLCVMPLGVETHGWFTIYSVLISFLSFISLYCFLFCFTHQKSASGRRMDAFVMSAGTGGTIGGVSK